MFLSWPHHRAALWPFAVAILLALPTSPVSGQVEVGGYAGAELRVFPAKPLRDVQPRWLGSSVKLVAEATVSLAASVGFRTIALGRVDESDPERTYADLQEALVQWDRGPVLLTLGINTVFWGVTESRHLVDIVNQTNYLEDLDGDHKFGQAMAAVTYYSARGGILDVFVMTGARTQRYPGVEGRPGVPVEVLHDQPMWESDDERWHLDLAARWSHAVADLDWALSYFQGTARDPELLSVTVAGAPALQPRYGLIRQVGLELQWTRGGWLWKAEGLWRSGQGPSFEALTGGFEYTAFGVLGSSLDVGAIIEYSYDGRENLTYNVYDGDAFGGLRVTFNDREGTELLAGVLQDVESRVTMGSLELSRRLGDRWRGELTARVFRAEDEEDPLYWYRRDDLAQIAVEFHF